MLFRSQTREFVEEAQKNKDLRDKYNQEVLDVKAQRNDFNDKANVLFEDIESFKKDHGTAKSRGIKEIQKQIELMEYRQQTEVFTTDKERELIDKIYYSVLLLLLFSPVVHPWYVGWLAALLPIARRWSGLLFVSTLSLTCFTYISYQVHGVWKEEPAVWLLEYLPVIFMMIVELARHTRVGRDHAGA